jgi:hypothetical protein
MHFQASKQSMALAADFTESISDEDDSIGSRRRVVHLPAVVEQGNACDAWIQGGLQKRQVNRWNRLKQLS